MIERAPVSGYWASCDFCSHEEEVDVQTFGEAICDLKEFGWTIRKNGDEWTHRCPGCSGTTRAKKS